MRDWITVDILRVKQDMNHALLESLGDLPKTQVCIDLFNLTQNTTDIQGTLLCGRHPLSGLHILW